MDGNIEIVERIPSSEEFFDFYVTGSKPAVFKRLLITFQGVIFGRMAV